MKSKAEVLTFGESLNYKSGLGFFVPALEEVPSFEVPIRALLAKMAILRGNKMRLPPLVQFNHSPKNRSVAFHFIFVTFDSVF